MINDISSIVKGIIISRKITIKVGKNLVLLALVTLIQK